MIGEGSEQNGEGERGGGRKKEKKRKRVHRGHRAWRV